MHNEDKIYTSSHCTGILVSLLLLNVCTMGQHYTQILTKMIKYKTYNVTLQIFDLIIEYAIGIPYQHQHLE